MAKKQEEPGSAIAALSLRESAKRLGMGYETLRRLAAAGRVPAFRIGGVWKILEQDLLAYARKQYAKGAERPGTTAK